MEQLEQLEISVVEVNIVCYRHHLALNSSQTVAEGVYLQKVAVPSLVVQFLNVLHVVFAVRVGLIVRKVQAFVLALHDIDERKREVSFFFAVEFLVEVQVLVCLVVLDLLGYFGVDVPALLT